MSDLSKYDNLECPRGCGTICHPVKELKSGTVQYNKHPCKPSYESYGIEKYTKPKRRQFSINIDGEVVGMS
jgi:hypothetical protein